MSELTNLRVINVEVELRACDRTVWAQIVGECRDKSSASDIHNSLNALLNPNRAKPTEIEKVIFNPPATVILWKDGAKTVVKAKEGEEFDPEKGFALAYMKKFVDYSTVKKEMKRLVRAYEESKMSEQEDYHRGLQEIIDGVSRQFQNALLAIRPNTYGGE